MVPANHPNLSLITSSHVSSFRNPSHPFRYRCIQLIFSETSPLLVNDHLSEGGRPAIFFNRGKQECKYFLHDFWLQKDVRAEKLRKWQNELWKYDSATRIFSTLRFRRTKLTSSPLSRLDRLKRLSALSHGQPAAFLLYCAKSWPDNRLSVEWSLFREKIGSHRQFSILDK